jgi:tetratricopeptide (TPR) repeat protein
MLWGELGAVMQQEKNWPEALAAYTEAESAAELSYDKDSKQINTPLTRALRGQGYVLIETGKLDEAEQRYQRCLQLDPDDEGAKRELNYIANLRKKQQLLRIDQ